MSHSSQRKGRQTSYSNKVGLWSNKKDTFINQVNDVVISFPFKDCILEGGMSREDAGREERFLNEGLELDSADIDTLKEQKVLTNFKYIDKDGEKVLDSNSDIEFFDKDGELKENLLIKGNNLLALYSLRSKLAGKVKLIYIDPPYNTGNDGFKYNDNFKHSTWLVFMKNRLEIARELLRDDGVIFVQCDDNEQAYLKVLMDEVFTKGNVDCIVWQKMDARYDQNTNAKVINRYKEVHEYVLIGYKGNRKDYFFNKIKKLPDWKNEQSNPDNDLRGKYKQGIISFKEGHDNEDKNSENYYSIILPSGRIMTRYFFVKKEEFEALRKENRIYFPSDGDGVPALKVFENEEQEYKLESIMRGFGTSSTAKNELEILFGDRELFGTPKPEKLMSELIRVVTKENDIVLDYHLGSGTTAAVAHKMGRRWIGIEQMDYIEDIAKVRLQKVIGTSEVQGEQGGISKSVGWAGGGSFVYLELKKYNQEYVEQIQNAKTKEELNVVYQEMSKNAFLWFAFDKKDFERNEEYKSLPLIEQKRKLIEMLDNNQLYLNYMDMNDKRHNVSQIDKVLTERFYQEKDTDIE